MIISLSAQPLLYATTTKLVRKENRLLCLCGNWLFRRNRKRNMMTSAVYGIETEDGIFEIKPIINESQQQQQQQLFKSKLANKRFLEFHHSQTTDTHPIEQLLSLQKLSTEKHSPNVSGFKGFHISDIFQPTVTLATDTISVSNYGHGLTKTVFEFMDTGVLKLVASDNAASFEGDFCLVKYQGTHPIFDVGLSRFAPVYKTLEQAKSFLSKLCSLHHLKEVKQLTDSMLDQPTTIGYTSKHPFVVVEGLDGTGKSTMTNNLGRHLGAEILGTPPDPIKHIRKHFDVFPELCRRSFYAYGNYLAAEQISQVLDNRPVVLDRYWHSTTAYAIAKDSGAGMAEYLPPVNSALYSWPEDLLKPSAVVFLTTGEKERDQRLDTRDERTAEENELRDSQLFRKRILEVYRRIGLQGAWVEVDTGGTQEESLQKALDGLKKIGVL